MLKTEEKEKLCKCCAENLKLLRVCIGWNQGDLAEVVGTTCSRISEIETGKKKMNWTLFLAMTTVFSLNPKTKNSPIYSMIFTEDVIQSIGNLK